jgi:uncharacterized protein (DUF1330 family)
MPSVISPRDIEEIMMTSGLAPAFLLLKPRAADAALIATWCKAIEAARGTILAASVPQSVEVLEKGTVHTGLIIARFVWAADLESFWASAAGLAATLPEGSQAMSLPGLPFEGWPGHFVPTIATVDVPASESPRGYMVIEGTPGDESRMDQYRDTILPMLRERGGYYIAFELGGAIKVLHGEWNDVIIAISRWPDVSRAQDFWYSERYQTVAIPIRTGHGRFDVQLTAGIAG